MNKPWIDYMWANDPRKLRRQVRRAWNRGELHSIGETIHVQPGVWSTKVVRVRAARPPAPRYSRVMAGAVLLGAVLVLLTWCVLGVVRWAAGNTVALTAAGLLDAAGVLIFAVRVLRFLGSPNPDS